MLGFGLGLNKWRRVGGYVGLLDLFPNAAAAYSLRKLRAAYSGSAVRVRRSSDSTEQDIGFTTQGELDTASLLSFVGGQNFLLQSNQFDTTWALLNSQVTSGQSGYDGSTDAWLLERSGGGFSVFIRSTTITASGICTISIYAKAGNSNWLAIQDVGASNVLSTFDLSNGTIGAASPAIIDSQITSVGNGWYRCSITTNRSSGVVQFYVATTSGNLQGPPDAALYIQDAQLEEGSIATTYNPTTTGIGGDGLVSAWYDQSLSNDATQSTATTQPKIVSGGSLVTENGKAAVDFDGTGIYLATSAIPEVTQPVTHIATLKYTSGQTSEIPFSSLSDVNGRNLSYKTNSNYAMFAGSVFESATAVTNDQQLNFSLFNGASSSMWKDGTLIIDNESVGTETIEGITIGSDHDANPDFFGKIQEYMVYASDQSANRTAIETNINTFYSIYP